MKFWLDVKPVGMPRPRLGGRGVYVPDNGWKAIQELIALKIKTLNHVPMKLNLMFVFKNKKHDGSFHTSRPDIDNLTKTIMDGLEKATGVNDCFFAMIMATKIISTTTEGISVEITELEGSHE